MSKKKGAKGPCPEAAKPRKKPTNRDIMRHFSRMKRFSSMGHRIEKVEKSEGEA
jgi:hypothetical protein